MSGSRRAISPLLAALLTVLGPSPFAAAPAHGHPSRSVDVRAVAVDTDGDGIDDATDGCPGVASTNPTGCPTVSRSARLRYLAGENLLQAQVRSPETACSARSRVKLWRVLPRGDVRIQVETAGFSGRKRFTVPRGSSYYVTVSSSYAPGVAECVEATSPTVLVPRLS